MMRILILALSLSLALAAGCKTDDEATANQPDPSTERPATNTGAAQPNQVRAEPPADPSADDETAVGTFGALVDGATIVTVNRRKQDGTPGADHQIDDADWIAKFVTAVGPDNAGSDGIPRCMPTHTFTFADADGELAAFSGVCSGTDTAILVRDGKAYTASDPATIREMLQAFVPEGAE